MADSTDNPFLPKRTGADDLHGLAKAALGSAPVLGPLAAELFSNLIRTPFEARLEEWMASVEQRFKRIQRSMPERFIRLMKDPEFASLFLAATQAAVSTHQEEKRRLLAAAVEHSATGTLLNNEQQLAFIRYVGELSPAHVELLSMLASDTSLGRISAFRYLHEAILERRGLQRSVENMRLLLNDLETRLLVRVSRDLEEVSRVYAPTLIATEGVDPNPFVLVTETGLSFLDYVHESAV